MGLYKQIEDEMRVALKSGDAAKLSVLRMLVAAVKNLAIEKNLKEIQDQDVLQIIQRHIKQHKESIDQFEKGKRPDLVDKEKLELKILEAYMPKQLSEEELAGIIKDAMVESGISAKQDTGKLMKIVMEKVKGRSDGKIVNQLVMKLLK